MPGPGPTGRPSSGGQGGRGEGGHGQAGQAMLMGAGPSPAAALMWGPGKVGRGPRLGGDLGALTLRLLSPFFYN